MTPVEFKAARHALGLSAEGLARTIGVATGRTVRKWEAGDRDIPGPAALLMRLFMADARILPLAQSLQS